MSEQAPESLGRIRAELQEGIGLAKCRKCGCMIPRRPVERRCRSLYLSWKEPRAGSPFCLRGPYDFGADGQLGDILH